MFGSCEVLQINSKCCLFDFSSSVIIVGLTSTFGKEKKNDIMVNVILTNHAFFLNECAECYPCRKKGEWVT